VSTSGLVLAAVYSLLMMARVFYGKPQVADDGHGTGEGNTLRDLNGRELTTMLSLMAITLFIGLYPQPFLNLVRAPMAAVETIYHAAAVATAPSASAVAGGTP
jgi:NADH-quinone oxidoreductase subunit M